MGWVLKLDIKLFDFVTPQPSTYGVIFCPYFGQKKYMQVLKLLQTCLIILNQRNEGIILIAD